MTIMTSVYFLLVTILLVTALQMVRGLFVSRALRRFSDGLACQPIGDALSIQQVDGFMSDSEIERIMRLANPKLKRSRVLIPAGKSAAKASIRTSSTAFLVGFRFDPILAIIKRKAAILAGVPTSHIENIQVVRYEKGEHYGEHLDAMDFEKFPQEVKKGQRIATVLVYLNDVDNGSGKTCFPALGLDVTPQRGKAIFFRNTSEDGCIDRRSLHSAAPVEGEDVVKWAMNIWVRDRPLPLNHR